MPYYKNNEDDLYWIDSEEFEHVIPAGYIKITEEEAEPILELHRNPPPTAERIRAERNVLLAASDWTQLPDVPQSIKDLWAPYRQALRDVPEQEGFPLNVQWPVAPSSLSPGQ